MRTPTGQWFVQLFMIYCRHFWKIWNAFEILTRTAESSWNVVNCERGRAALWCIHFSRSMILRRHWREYGLHRAAIWCLSAVWHPAIILRKKERRFVGEVTRVTWAKQQEEKTGIRQDIRPVFSAWPTPWPTRENERMETMEWTGLDLILFGEKSSGKPCTGRAGRLSSTW